MDIKNKRIPDDEFARLRQEVLTQWPTGKDVDLQEAVDYHKAMEEDRIFSKKLLAAKAEGKTLVQPRAGVPVISPGWCAPWGCSCSRAGCRRCRRPRSW